MDPEQEVDPNVVEATTEQDPAAEAAAPVMIPKERLDEVLAKNSDAQNQIAQYQQELYAAQLRLQKLEAESAAREKFATQPQQSGAPVSPEEAKQRAVQAQLKTLMQDAVSPIIQQQIASLNAQLAPVHEVIEDTRRTKFWSDPSNAALPDDLKQAAEKAYMQYKTQIPNLDRSVALQFAKGAFWDKQVATTKAQAATNKETLAAVNRAASQTPSGPGATNRAPKSDNEKRANDLDNELRQSAERNYR